MDRRSFLLGCGGCSVLPPRFTRPELESEEGGLWAYMDREERRLQRSPFLIRNEDLNAYIRANQDPRNRGFRFSMKARRPSA